MNKQIIPYSEQLKDPRWQKRKNEILERDNYSCQLCGSKHKTLHVHHRYYIDYREPWKYSDNVLVTLCEDCHTWVHTNYTHEKAPIKIGDVIHFEHSEYDCYGIVFLVDYNDKNFYSLTIDTGAGFSDCVIYSFGFNEINSEINILENFFNEGNYYSTSLFYCFYGILKGNNMVNLDYFKKSHGIDSLLALIYNSQEMIDKNESLNNFYLSAENGNLSFLED